MNQIIDLVRRWPWTTAWVAYTFYVSTVFYLVGALR